MSINQNLTNLLPDVLEVARHAPSVHNTQPWKVKLLYNDAIEITIDEEHVLKDGDPTGRQTIISLGIFTESVCIGLESQGLKAKNIAFKNNTVVINLSESKIPIDNPRQVELLKSRCSDRSIYKPVNITNQFDVSIKNLLHESNVKINVITDKILLGSISLFTSKGIRLALSSPGFREELKKYLVPMGSTKDRGISVKSLYLPNLLSIIEPWLIGLGIGLDTEANLEKKRWESASAAVIITSKGDMPDDWFAVGKLYLKTSLLIEEYGMSQATSASIVEASDFHEDIEKMIGTEERIQSIIRIGKGKDKRYHSPRISAEELVAT